MVAQHSHLECGCVARTLLRRARTCTCPARGSASSCAQAVLRRLDRAGQWRDVVFLDMDAPVVAPLAPAFVAAGDAEGPAFDLALALSDATDMCAARPSAPILRHPCCRVISGALSERSSAS